MLSAAAPGVPHSLLLSFDALRSRRIRFRGSWKEPLRFRSTRMTTLNK
jgi:hypothetical protein